MTANTYTVFHAENSDDAQRNLTLPAAAHALLTYDSQSYELRRDSLGGWRLWWKRLNGRFVSTLCVAYEPDRSAAERLIWKQVLDIWDTPYAALTDDQYDAMRATAAAAEDDAACDYALAA